MKNKSIIKPMNFNEYSSQIKWLSSYDIEQIMSPYENVYLDFVFIGAIPSDYYDVTQTCVDFDTLTNNNKNQLGIIFNLDVCKGHGTHWTALYINIKKAEIYFCDSSGLPPIENIKIFINTFQKYYTNKYQTAVNYEYNKTPIKCENDIYSCQVIIKKLINNENELLRTNVKPN